jgi:hypothetical protein
MRSNKIGNLQKSKFEFSRPFQQTLGEQKFAKVQVSTRTSSQPLPDDSPSFPHCPSSLLDSPLSTSHLPCPDPDRETQKKGGETTGPPPISLPLSLPALACQHARDRSIVHSRARQKASKAAAPAIEAVHAIGPPHRPSPGVPSPAYKRSLRAHHRCCTAPGSLLDITTSSIFPSFGF